MIKKGEKVRFQKDCAIEKSCTVFDYASHAATGIDPEAVIAVVSVDGTLYELNMPAAVIFEEIIRGQPVEQVTESIMQLFDVEQDKAARAVIRCVEDLKQKKALVET